MYAVISLPLESRTLATLRRAELGFLGVIVLTWRQTPRLNGQASSTGDLVLYCTGRRGLRTSWLIVGMSQSFPLRGALDSGLPELTLHSLSAGVRSNLAIATRPWAPRRCRGLRAASRTSPSVRPAIMAGMSDSTPRPGVHTKAVYAFLPEPKHAVYRNRRDCQDAGPAFGLAAGHPGTCLRRRLNP